MGGVNAVFATLNLLRLSLEQGCYSRYVFLQGADYPIKNAEDVLSFFETNREVEFIRGCEIMHSSRWHDRCKCQVWYAKGRESFHGKLWNKMCVSAHVRMRDGYAPTDSRGKLPVYWGPAQWAITRECAQYILDTAANDASYCRWFEHAFPPDELFFQTTIFNSPFREKTMSSGPEQVGLRLEDYAALHYFTYPDKVRVLNLSDCETISNLESLYISKVNTDCSSGLLNFIDSKRQDWHIPS